MLPLEEYQVLRTRPQGGHAMLQSWRDLTFLHFPADPGEIQKLIPESLTVDTFPDASGEAKAWVGLVPFRMQGVTPAHVPPIPGCHAFPETNVRTYVHRQGQLPGVWFFSLDASNAFACRVARRFYGLPYHHAAMSVERSGEHLTYRSARRGSEVGHEIKATVGPPTQSAPGSLEFFLVERYLLYSLRDGKMHTGSVHHRPYPTHSVEVNACRESLIQANGIVPRPFGHTLFSPGVDVEVFALKPV